VEAVTVKFAVALLFTVMALEPATVVHTEYQTVVRTVEVEAERAPFEPRPPGLTDAEWAEYERQAECQWTLMRDRNMPITYENVVAVDIWADHHGGACAMIGED
jgi:hypothetical protein